MSAAVRWTKVVLPEPAIPKTMIAVGISLKSLTRDWVFDVDLDLEVDSQDMVRI